MERGLIGGCRVTDNETAPFGSCITPMRGLDQSQGLVPCITQHGLSDLEGQASQDHPVTVPGETKRQGVGTADPLGSVLVQQMQEGGVIVDVATSERGGYPKGLTGTPWA